jgi:macrolide-specific efflux system membrane fusion protein
MLSVARKWVFPIIRIVIFIAIAGALVKLAFFSDAVKPQSVAVPSAQISEPLVRVHTGNVVNNVHVTGTVQADAAVPVKATLAGEIVKVLAPSGGAIATGAPVVTIKADIPGVENPDGTVAPDTHKTVTVAVPASGVLSSLAVIPGQVVEVGDAIGQVAPPTFSVSATLTPAQLYRLLNQPTQATVTITGGPAPFACPGLIIATTLAGASSTNASSSDGSSDSSGGTTVHCAVPSTVRVFNGLQADMSIPGGSVQNVLIAPVTAVEGIADVGDVYVMNSNGKSAKKAVTLGLNDGKHVQILTGLKDGDSILQFVPGAKKSDGCDGAADCAAAGQ